MTREQRRDEGPDFFPWQKFSIDKHAAEEQHDGAPSVIVVEQVADGVARLVLRRALRERF
jgi:hypothetical protein